MSFYFVYIVEITTKTDKKSYYTGYTKDLHRRLKEHKNGVGARYCRGKKSIKLKYFQTFTERQEAMKRELEIKSFSRKKKVELIKNFNNS
ncbi:MAG: GIY-YIG nuclease family protein [Promethearchaeota archaeon]